MRHIILFLAYLTQIGNNYCLYESGTTVGSNSTGEVFSNLAEIEALGPSNYTLHAFDTCTDYQ